jgi:nucleotidyltransferase AbiEii toxin of type IV toxin-antitoxin system
MSGKVTNIAASVAARLLQRAKRTGDDYQTLLTNFCFERFLYRLAASAVRDRFILKGAMLLRVWSDQPYRATRDMDLLRRGDASFEAIRRDVRIACEAPVEPDGVSFDPNAALIEAIRAEDEYAGARTMLPARCDTARLMLQIDMGVGDSVWPAPTPCVYPGLLDFPAPQVLAYPREVVVAEKFEAMVVLGNRNSRIKDFFDLHFLANHFEFERATLTEAVQKTFDRRHTPIPTDAPVALTQTYWRDSSRPAQLRAFAKRARLTAPDVPEEAFGKLLGAFLNPILDDLRQRQRRAGVWKPGGPWK